MTPTSGTVVSFDWQRRVRDLWRLLDRVSGLGFSLDPRDVAQNVDAMWDLVNRLWDVATEPPPGNPTAIDEAADDWKRLADELGTTASELSRTAHGLDTFWVGEAADACRGTLVELGTRYDDAAALARSAYRTLSVYADAIRDARARHAAMGDHVRAAADRIGPCLPWLVADMVRDVTGHVVDAAHAAIGSYQDAGEATATCRRELAVVTDAMPFPDGAAPGLSAFDLIGLHDPGAERGPLSGDVANRAAEAYGALAAQDRAAVDALLEQSPTARHRAWIVAALATGTSVVALTAFAARIRPLKADLLGRALDPTAQPAGTLKQQSSTTCGSASLVVARMLTDPVYALWVLDGYDAETGRTDSGDLQSRFTEEERQIKARTNDVVNRSGGFSLPWPPGLGTPPWGASEELNHAAGVPGTSYGLGLVDSDSVTDRQRAYDALAASADSGRPAPLYVGDTASPRHVVLVVERTSAGLQVYEPWNGAVVTVSESDFVSGNLSLGGWERPWATVTA